MTGCGDSLTELVVDTLLIRWALTGCAISALVASLGTRAGNGRLVAWHRTLVKLAVNAHLVSWAISGRTICAFILTLLAGTSRRGSRNRVIANSRCTFAELIVDALLVRRTVTTCSICTLVRALCAGAWDLLTRWSALVELT